MNYYNTIFISKINKKLNKIINGIKLLNSINNTISIQSGGSGLSEAINTFAKKQLVIYNTEEYEKLVTKFLKEIAILRAVIIELLSQLHEKNQDEYKDMSKEELEKQKEDLESKISKTIETIKLKTPAQPNIKPAEEPQSVTYTSHEKVPTVFKEDGITIYSPTQGTYSDFYSSKIRAPLWSKDMKQPISGTKSSDSIYDENNINNIYVISINEPNNALYLVSFKHNDLRDSNNKQLTLNKLYEYITKKITSDIYNKFISWMTGEITKYVESIKTSKTKIAVKTGEKDATDPSTKSPVSSTTYRADNCSRYNIIYHKDSILDKYTTLKIIDKGTDYDKTSRIFGSVPFYIDIYEFISKFINCTKIDITGDFSAQFYLLKEQSTPYMNTPPFNNIAQLVCSDCALTSVNQILKLCKGLQSIKISFTNDQSRKTICNFTNILSFFNKINQLINSKILKQIDISPSLNPENVNLCGFVESETIKTQFNSLLQAVKATSATLTYND